MDANTEIYSNVFLVAISLIIAPLSFLFYRRHGQLIDLMLSSITIFALCSYLTKHAELYIPFSTILHFMFVSLLSIFIFNLLHLRSLPLKKILNVKTIKIRLFIVYILFLVYSLYNPSATPIASSILLISTLLVSIFLVTSSSRHDMKGLVFILGLILVISLESMCVVLAFNESTISCLVDVIAYILLLFLLVYARINLLFLENLELQETKIELARARKAVFVTDTYNLLSRMVSGITHELGTPSVVINSLMRFMRRNPGEPIPEELLMDVHAAAQGLANIHSELGNLISNDNHFVVETLSINDCIISAKKLADYILENVQIEINVPEDAKFDAVRNHVIHIFLNLFLYSAQSVKESIYDPEAFIRIDYDPSTKVLLWVDSGINSGNEFLKMDEITPSKTLNHYQSVKHGLFVAKELANFNNLIFAFQKGSGKGNTFLLQQTSTE